MSETPVDAGSESGDDATEEVLTSPNGVIEASEGASEQSEERQRGGEHDPSSDAAPEVYSVPASAAHRFEGIFGAIATLRGRPLVVLCSESIREKTAHELYKWRSTLSRLGEQSGFDVLLHSPGGDLTSCYRIARMLSNFTKDWQALVPTMAASGATLISLGSSRIVLSDYAQLGPLDPQVISKRTTKFFMHERQSPLEAFQAVKYLRRTTLETLDATMLYLLGQQGVAPQTAVETASKIAVEMTKPIFDKIEPYDLGAFAQDNGLALAYCQGIAGPNDRAVRSQRNVNFTALVEDYTAHEFFIDLQEARDLGFEVERPDDLLEELFVLYRDMESQFGGIRELIGLYYPLSAQEDQADGRAATGK